MTDFKTPDQNQTPNSEKSPDQDDAVNTSNNDEATTENQEQTNVLSDEDKSLRPQSAPVEESAPSQQTTNPRQQVPPPPPINPAGAQYPPAPPPGFYGYALPQENKKSSFFQSWLAKTLGGALVSLLIFVVIMGVYASMISSAVGTRPGMQESFFEGEMDAETKITILPVDGMIGDGTRHFLKRALKFITTKSNKPKAIILRINSPGGGLSASDQIAHLLEKFQEEHDIPIVASYGQISASGGVYISAGCKQIVAENTTMTGSIGVIAQAFTYHEFLDKVGVTPEIVVAEESPKKDVLDGSRPWTEQDRAVLRKFLDAGQKMFKDQIRKGRKDKMTDEQFAAATTGEPFTASEALDLGLIDKVGYLEDAITIAKEEAKLDKDAKIKVTRVTETVSPFSQLLSLKSAEVTPEISLDKILTPEMVREMLAELSTPRIEARMP